MRSSKLFRLLKILSKKELESLDGFLNNSYTNGNKLTYELYKYIFRYRKYIHAPKSTKLNKKIVYNNLFNGTYDDLKIRRVMSLLTKQIEDFLVSEELKKKENSRHRDKLLVESLSRRNDYLKFKLETETQIRKLQTRQYKSRADFLDLFWLHEKLYTHPETNTFNAKGASDLLNGLMENLDEYIVFSKLFWGLEYKNRYDNFEDDYSNYFQHEALTIAEKFEDAAKRYDFFKILFTTDEVNPENANLLKDYIRMFIDFYTDHSKNIPESDFILNALVTKTIRYMNAGVSDFKFLLLNLYKFGVKEGLFLQNGLLRGIHFSNISILAASQYEFKWSKLFMKSNEAKVPDDEREYVVNLSYAFWHFHKGLASSAKNEFMIAQQYLAKISYKFLENDLRVRSLHLRILFEYEVRENNNHSILVDNSLAFKAFLNRNSELSEKRKQSYSNFIDAVVLLTKLQLENDKNKCLLISKRLKHILESNSYLISKAWLHDKFSALKDKSEVFSLA